MTKQGSTEDHTGLEARAPAASCGRGDCDAYPVLGGVTTEDEMFMLLGGYDLP
ncbi:MAG: hypothetical protein O7B23_07945 [Deltaproteobacteria bacterium]|nr:hypothetical protein [Deltaproteobacteria bacterium]MCZ6713145.1 hypothetical protein [Deltaproteobacteria bacterium]